MQPYYPEMWLRSYLTLRLYPGHGPEDIGRYPGHMTPGYSSGDILGHMPRIFLYLPAYVQPKKAAEKFFVTKFYEKWYT